MAEHTNAQRIRDGYAAFSAGDLAALSQLFAQDILWHEAGTVGVGPAGDYKGQDAVFTMFGELIQRTDEFGVRLEDVIADDHQAIATHSAMARRGERLYNAREAIVFHFLDGRVTDAWHTVPDMAAYDAFWDDASILAAPATPLDRMAGEHPHVDLLRRGYEAFGAGDLATIAAMLTPSSTWHVRNGSPLDGDYVGADEIFGFFGRLIQETEGSLELTVRSILADDEYVVALITGSASRHGVSWASDTVHVYRMERGLVAEQWSAVTDVPGELAFWSGTAS